MEDLFPQKRAKPTKKTYCYRCNKPVYSNEVLDYLFENSCCIECYKVIREDYPYLYAQEIFDEIKKKK